MKKYYSLLIAFLFVALANAQIVSIPDTNFKAKLLQANSSQVIASTVSPVRLSGSNVWAASNYNTIDTNGDGEIQVSEAQVIKFLRLNNSNISNLTGIEAFTNLECLECNSNQLTSLNVSGLTSLKGLNCVTNQLSSLNINGLVNLQSLDYSNNQLSNLDVSELTNLVLLECRSNGVTSLDVSNNTNLQNLGCGSNQLTSLDISSNINLQSLNCNENQLTNLNVSNNINLQYFFCSDNQLTSLDLNNNPLLTFLNCNNNNQLTSMFIKNNNTTWTNLNFSNNPNLTYICSDEDDLELVQNQVNSAGLTSTCNVNSYCSFTPGGINYIIQGNSKFDFNGNGCDASDVNYPNMKYNITNGTISGSIISNESGNYSIPVSAGTHTFTPQLENPTYFTVSPTTATVTFPDTASPFTQDFCLTPNGIHNDLEVVVIPVNTARPGFDTTYKIKYKNKGNQAVTASLSFNYNDATLDFISSSITVASQSTGVLNWDLGNITPFQEGEILFTMNLNSPMETPALNAGAILNYSATISSTITDETPIDNVATLIQTVFNSFDPNDKTCLEGNTINPSKIGEYIHYMIRFENTGTYPAENIVVKDMIDTSKFDISTLQIISTSHSCYTRIDGNKVEFIFENINLPFDDATNDGYVVFKIKTLPTLTVGSTISNQASIYFDYNFPIVTNTATSTFTTLKNNNFDFANNFTLYPNPVENSLSITNRNNLEITSISIYNTLGQVILIETNPSNSIDTSSLKKGSYFIKIISDKGISSSKFIKE